MSIVVVNRRLYLDASKTVLLEDGDPRAAFLWRAAGHEVSSSEAKKLGYSPHEKREAPKSQTEKVEAPKSTPKRGRPRKSK